MRDPLHRGLLAVSAAAALLAVLGCQAQDQKTAGNGTVAEKTPSAAASSNESIRGAAEPFESLTEQAFSADWAAIDKLIGDARTATSSASLGDPARSELERRFDAISAARIRQDRVALALASVEGYRELIQAQDPAAADPPVAVSLLDYAGFRFDALAQAPEPNWAEMARSVDFAHSQWRNISGQVPSNAMQGVMSEALSGMARAVERQDVAFARSAAATELALVDLLEEQTSRKR